MEEYIAISEKLKLSHVGLFLFGILIYKQVVLRKKNIKIEEGDYSVTHASRAGQKPVLSLEHQPVQSIGSIAAENEISASEYVKSAPSSPQRTNPGFNVEAPPGSPPVSRKLGTSSGASHSSETSQDDTSFMFLTPVSSSISLAEPLVRRISEADTRMIVIGIAGGSGSGKTTLARAIYESIGEENITFLSHDSYYRDLSHLPEQERGRQNFDHPDALETSLLVSHVKKLKKGQNINSPSYDYATHLRKTGTTLLSPRPVVLVEGILIFSVKELYDLMDIKIFVDTDDDIRLIRRIQRDTQERGRSLMGIVNQYMGTVRPMHLQFVEPSKRNADIIVPVGLNSVALDLVVSKLKSHLAEEEENKLSTRPPNF